MEPQAQLQIADFRNDTNFPVQASPGTRTSTSTSSSVRKGHAGAQAAVRPAGTHHRASTGRRSPALCTGRSLPACRRSEHHLQDRSRRATSRTTTKWTFNQKKVITHPEGQGLHRWARQAERGQQQHLLVPGRRQAVVPLRHDHRQPAPRADVRDHPEAAQERRHRAPAALPAGGPLFGTTLPSGDWDLDHVHVGRVALLRRSRPRTYYACGGEHQLRQLLQPQGDGAR